MGIGRVVDLSGKRYEMLVVQDYCMTDKKGSHWICKCDCGNFHIVSTKNLNTGGTKSCGCKKENYLKSRRMGFGESSFNQLYKNYILGAKRRNKEFCITKKEFKKLTKGNCFYCGEELKRKIKNKSGYGYYIYNGIDRINNNDGYVLGNVVSCCTDCNTMKMSLTHDEFIKKIKKIYNMFYYGN